LFCKATNWLETTTAFWTKRSIYIDSHEWMPFESDYSLEKSWRVKPSVCHNNDSEMSWDVMSDQSQHAQPFFVPSSLLITFGVCSSVTRRNENSPCDRYTTSTIDDANHQSSERKPKSSTEQLLTVGIATS
jgi:hypothetical protein